eukprot:1341463-Amorphochlora_amoeboformis.AAC.2
MPEEKNRDEKQKRRTIIFRISTIYKISQTVQNLKDTELLSMLNPEQTTYIPYYSLHSMLSIFTYFSR